MRYRRHRPTLTLWASAPLRAQPAFSEVVAPITAPVTNVVASVTQAVAPVSQTVATVVQPVSAAVTPALVAVAPVLEQLTITASEAIAPVAASIDPVLAATAPLVTGSPTLTTPNLGAATTTGDPLSVRASTAQGSGSSFAALAMEPSVRLSAPEVAAAFVIAHPPVGQPTGYPIPAPVDPVVLPSAPVFDLGSTSD